MNDILMTNGQINGRFNYWWVYEWMNRSIDMDG